MILEPVYKWHGSLNHGDIAAYLSIDKSADAGAARLQVELELELQISRKLTDSSSIISLPLTPLYDLEIRYLLD